MTIKLESKLLIACVVIAVIGFMPMPYAYYQFLRIIFFGTLIWFFKSTFITHIKKELKLILLLLIALYNPFFPLHLGSKIAWALLNLGTCMFLYWNANNHMPPSHTEEKNKGT